MTSVFRGAIEFFDRLGIYDVLLPFLLVFAIVFAILEKTKIFGTEGKEEIPRRSINSLVAFCIGFFVVASTQLVSTINDFLAKVTLLIIVCVFFLALVGIFYKEKDSEDDYLTKKWKMGFTITLLVAILLIFASSIKTRTNVSWLEYGWNYLLLNATSSVVSSIVLLIVVISGLVWITKGEGKPAKEE
ncbi:MAG: hypothetical protein ACMXYC_00965 [Candidatus Woesearchaeota archaeon]